MSAPANLQLSSAIVQTLGDLRRMLRRYVAIQGLLLIALWLMLAFWLGGLIDYLPVRVGANESPWGLRLGLLLVMAGVSLWILVRWVLARLWVKVDDKSLALLVERLYPQLNSELVTVVELSERPSEEISNPIAYREMLQRTHRSASEHMGVVRPSELFDWQPLWAAGIATVFGLVITAVAALGMSDWMGRWSRRLFLLAEEPWPRQAALRADGLQLQVPAFSTQLAAQRVWLPFEDGQVRVPLGSTPVLQVSADAQAVRVPEVCTLFYRTSDGGRGRANLRRVGSPRREWQPFTLDGPPLDGLDSDIQIDVVGLDARLRDLSILVVEPAVIADMQLECVYPNYLLDSLSVRGARETLAYRSGMAVPEGTGLTLLGHASQPLSRVDYLLLSSQVESNPAEDKSDQASVTAVRSVECHGNEFQIPLDIVRSSQVIEVRLIDQYGLSAEQIPRYVISVREDSIPEVDARLEGIGLGITPNAILPIVGTVRDDHGVQQVSAEVAINDSQPQQFPLMLQDTSLQSTLDMQQLGEQGVMQLQAGDTLGMLVAAQDYYDLNQQPHIGRGQPIQLSVVTADQLLVMLDRQELELRQRLELIVSELEQLQDVLVKLQAESEAESDIAQRLAGLWAQQSLLQADKSQQELMSVAARVDNLRQQLINNRIDSYDRQERLQLKVLLPLRELMAQEYPTLSTSLSELQAATIKGSGPARSGASEAATANRALVVVLQRLEEIKANMQDIEDFNEIVDLVRGLLDDQEKLLSETEQQQRQRILDLLR